MLQKIEQLAHWPSENTNPVVALGNFDGVHVGHTKLITRAVATARRMGVKSVVLTFKPHPLQVLNGAAFPGMLTSGQEKEREISALGVDILLAVPFDEQVAHLEPEEFVKTMLVQTLQVRGVVVGFDYTFGYRGAGKPEDLEEFGRIYGFETHVVPPVKVGDKVVCSTLIRSLIQDGKVDEVPPYLGRHYRVSGKVVPGGGVGRKLGFPTANLELCGPFVKPKDGVYIVRCLFDRGVCPGVVNVGIRPTFAGRAHATEVHLLDFSGDLYGAFLEVEFLRRIREERRFLNSAELVDQLKRDVAYARHWFRNFTFSRRCARISLS